MSLSTASNTGTKTMNPAETIKMLIRDLSRWSLDISKAKGLENVQGKLVRYDFPVHVLLPIYAKDFTRVLLLTKTKELVLRKDEVMVAEKNETYKIMHPFYLLQPRLLRGDIEATGFFSVIKRIIFGNPIQVPEGGVKRVLDHFNFIALEHETIYGRKIVVLEVSTSEVFVTLVDSISEITEPQIYVPLQELPRPTLGIIENDLKTMKTITDEIVQSYRRLLAIL